MLALYRSVSFLFQRKLPNIFLYIFLSHESNCYSALPIKILQHFHRRWTVFFSRFVISYSCCFFLLINILWFSSLQGTKRLCLKTVITRCSVYAHLTLSFSLTSFVSMFILLITKTAKCFFSFRQTRFEIRFFDFKFLNAKRCFFSIRCSFFNKVAIKTLNCFSGVHY